MKIFKKALMFILTLILTLNVLSLVTNVKGEEMKNKITIDGGSSSEISDGYNNTSGYKIEYTGTEAFVKIQNDEISKMNVFDTVIIEFRVKYDGEGYNDTLRVYKAEGDLVDYGYPGNTWNRVRFKTMVFSEDGENFVKAEIDYKKGETVYISDISVEKSEPDKPLLGGVKVYSMESTTLAMGYVIITPDNKVIVIDGGMTSEAANTLKFIRTFSNTVDYWFITHFHTDHASVVLTLLNNEDIHINNLYFDFPTTEQATSLSGDSDAYICDGLRKAIEDYPSKVDNIITPHKGDSYKIGDYVTIKALNDAWYDEKNNNYGNNSGIMYKMETPGESILFTGDMGDRGDTYLEDSWVKGEVESCTVIQMAHHGQNGVTDYFYSVIKDMKVCLYPSVAWIYNNDGGSGFNSATLKTLHTRDLVRERGVMNIYNTASGRKLIQ